jgi:hypothetical protein
MAEYEIVEHASDEDYPTAARPVRKSVRDALASIDAQRTAMQVQRDFGFDDTTFGYGTYEGKEILTYGLREQREENLKGAWKAHNNIWIFEKSEDAVIFSLRWS